MTKTLPMWIKTQNDRLGRLHDADCMPVDYRVEFSDTNLAQVPADVGEALIDKYAGISKHDPDTDDSDRDTTDEED